MPLYQCQPPTGYKDTADAWINTGALVSRMNVAVRLSNGGGGGFAAQHSQSVENWFLNVPGLKICVPATPADAYTLLRAAIRDDNPVLVFEHKLLYPQKGELESGDGRTGEVTTVDAEIALGVRRIGL